MPKEGITIEKNGSGARNMRVGKQRSSFLIKAIDSRTKKSKTFPVYDCDLSLEQLVKKLIQALCEE